MAWHTEVLTSLEAMDQLVPEWQALAATSPTPMAQPEWSLAAAASLDAGRPLQVVVVRDGDGRLAGVAPLVVVGGHLQPVGEASFEPPGFAFRDRAALEALFDAVGRLGRPLLMRRVYRDGAEAAVFASHPAGGIRPAARAAHATAIRRLDREDPDAGIAGRRRTAIRRKRKAAERAGLLVRFFSPDEAGAEETLALLVRIEGSGWKGRAGTAVIHHPPLGAFYRAYARAAARRGLLRFGLVTIGEAPAALRMDAEWAGQRWELKIAYDEQFTDFSPGQLLTYETFRDARERGASVHHFLGGYEPWQDDWGVELRGLTTLRHYPTSMAGVAAFASDVAGHGLEALKGRLRRAK